jgi:ribosomal protein S27E
MAKKKAATLFLHCKCNACTSWEVVFEGGKYYLKCASCPEKIEVYMSIDSPHPSIHWEA